MKPMYEPKFFLKDSFEFQDGRWVFLNGESLDGVKSRINEYKLKMAELDEVHKVFRPWRLGHLYENAESCLYSSWHDFLRFWLDQIVYQEGLSFWNHVNRIKLRELEGDRKALKKADQESDRVIEEFWSSFQ